MLYTSLLFLEGFFSPLQALINHNGIAIKTELKAAESSTYETRGIVVPGSFGISKGFQNRISLDDLIFQGPLYKEKREIKIIKALNTLFVTAMLFPQAPRLRMAEG